MTKNIFTEVREFLVNSGFTIISEDSTRPWGGFFVLNEIQIDKFCEVFFKGLDLNQLDKTQKLSPKILIIKPNSRLSWQYHERRSEIWQVYSGSVGVIRSMDNSQGKLEYLKKDSRIELEQSERHRLIGLEDYSIVAEIWKHTHAIPSDEYDIIRIEDDFGR